MPRNADFVAYNVYLEDPSALRAYLLRLQNLAGNKPLVITEYGLDAARHGEAAQAEALRAQRRALREAAVAGDVWFSYTDEWQRGGRAVEGWQFGLVITGMATGGVLGSLVADRISRRLSPGTSLLAAIAGSGLAFLAEGLATSPLTFWTAGVLGGLTVVLWNVITVSLRQRLIPDRLLGRVNSVYRFFGWGTISLGTALGGLLVSAAEPLLGREWALRAPLLLAGACTLALLPYAIPRVGTPQIRAAETAASETG